MKISNQLFNRVTGFLTSLSIAKKINYGYSLAIGIAVLGTTIGLTIGNHYQKQAQEQLTLASEQQLLLLTLENAVIAARLHPQKLADVVGDSIWFHYETSQFLGEITRIKTQLSELKTSMQDNSIDLTMDTEEFESSLRTYEIALDNYVQLMRSLWQQVDPLSLKPEQIPAAQQQVLSVLRGEDVTNITIEFERLSETLTRSIIEAETQQIQANASLRNAERLRLEIIAISMLLSTAIATVLALNTGKAIARPLETVNQIAQQVVKQSNFDLRVSVMTQDEVGSLANSINQLIQWVGEYTDELELSRDTLEHRVEERTQELTQALQYLKETQGQLIQTEKMSSLGQMVAGVAHEINNPINFIYGNVDHVNQYAQDLLELLDLYQQQYPQPASAIQNKIEVTDYDFLREDLPKTLTSMKMGTDRIRQIVLSLRNFSRLDEAEKKQVDIHEGIDNTLLLLNYQLKKGIEVIRKYGDIPWLECYPAQLNQVFMNILSNAIDALLVESTENKKQIIIQTQKTNSNLIQVGIWDNGPGIPPAVKDKLFDPFFTTKPVGQGTGLGLAICYQIIEKHNGKIEVVSEVGRGTEFLITLPNVAITSNWQRANPGLKCGFVSK